MSPVLWCFRSWLHTGNAPWPLHSAFGCNWECPDNDHNDQNEVIMSTRYRMCSVTLKSINIKQSIKRMTRYSIVNRYQYQKNEFKFKVTLSSKLKLSSFSSFFPASKEFLSFLPAKREISSLQGQTFNFSPLQEKKFYLWEKILSVRP